MDDIKLFAFADEADSTVDNQIIALTRNRLDGIEIRNVDGVNVSDITLSKAREVRHKLDASGLITWSIGSPIGKIGINDDFNPHLDTFKHTLEVADAIGCKNIRLFSFYIPEGENPDNYTQKVIERLSQLIDLSSGSGINLCHENEKGIYGDIPSRCEILHKALPELKGIFDPANFVQCGVDTLSAWRQLRSYIYYMHIKDAKSDGFVVPSGSGCGNIKELTEDFIAMGGKSFTIEPHLTVFDGLASLERAGEESKIGEFEYSNANAAFDAACQAFRKILGE